MSYEQIPINKPRQSPDPFSPVSNQRPVNSPPSNRLEFVAFCIFLATIVLAPLSFWPSAFISLDTVKTAIITLGTSVALILFGIFALKEKRLPLPPKSLSVISLLILLSLAISSLASIHAIKSFFGQGFEIGTGSFLTFLFLAALTAFLAVYRHFSRAMIVYVAMTTAFAVLYLLELTRLIFGADFMSFSILGNLTSTFIGGWYNFGSLALVVAIISSLAIYLLQVSRGLKITYWILVVLSLLAAVIVNDSRIWLAAALVFLGLTVYLYVTKVKSEGKLSASFLKRIAWIPLVLFAISTLFFFRGTAIVGPTITSLKMNYSELSLPWQLTLDVAASSIKNYPLFGVGPNSFVRAYLAYKPVGINSTEAWNTEFNNGFSLLSTFVATQGLIGSVLWVLFFVFFGLIGAKALKNISDQPLERFIVLSSYAAAVFLWIIFAVSVPSQAILYLAFVLTGLFVAAAMSTGSLPSNVWSPAEGSRSFRVMVPSILVCLLAVFLLGIVYLKNSVALLYFGQGVKQLTVVGNAEAADKDFSMALKFNPSDIYWRARVETSIARARQLAGTVTSATSAADSQRVLSDINSILNQGLIYAKNAISYDTTNYYDYLSEARISEAAAEVKMTNGFENATAAYITAAKYNPYNPLIYLSLANLKVKQNKLDEAIQAIGAAIQTKNNYLEAIFLLSQIYATKGDLPNAIIAAQVANQLNPNNPVLLFQLGLLQYSNKNYSAAVEVLDRAVNIQPDYANAKYFLGLAQARLGENAKAVSQFEDLARTNPDNQEVALILANLEAGKSIFAEAKPIVTPPEKRSGLPIKEKR